MKKILCMVLLLAMLLSTVVGCGDTETTTTPDTTEGVEDYEFPLPEGEQIVKHSYTAVLNDEEWTNTEEDTSKYTYVDTGVALYKTFQANLKGYNLSVVLTENGVENTYTGTKIWDAMKGLGRCGAVVTKNTADKTATVKLTPLATKVVPSWKAVTAKADSYFKFEFTASEAMEYAITVTPEKGGLNSTSTYTVEKVAVTGENGKYVGTAQCTVPYDAGKTYYLNICYPSSYIAITSIPVNIKRADYNDGFHLRFVGDWDLVNDESYTDKFPARCR